MRIHIPKGAYVALAACLLAGCSKTEEAESAPAAAPVQVATAGRETIRKLVQAEAVLFPFDQASVTPKIAAPVQKFYVNRGDHVKQGQLLATLENRDLAAAAAESKSQVTQAAANLRGTSNATVPEAVVKAQTDVTAAQQQFDAAQNLLQSRQDLFKQGALARRQVDEAQVTLAQAKAQLESAQEHLRGLQSVGKETQIGTAQAQLEAAQAHHDSVEAQLSYSQISSPISGVISDRPLYAGEMASPGTPLLTVMDISRIVARANLPQDQAALVKVGDDATITAGGRTVEGKVKVVSPATDPASTTVQVWVEAANPGESLKPGASAQISVVSARLPNAVVIPLAALLASEEGGTAVAVVGPDSTVHLKNVDVGAREPEKVQILSGVAPGDKVVVVGGVGLEDNAKVQIAGGEESKAADPEEK